METYLYQFYQNNLAPHILYLSEKLAEMKLLEEKFGFIGKIPQRGRKKEILNLAHENAQQV